MPASPEAGIAAVSLEELLAAADLISLHAPGSAGKRPLLDAAALGRLRPGAVVVNTARGELIDEDALRAAIAGGPVARAALDVTRDEPVPAGSPLRGESRIRLTAHTGSKGSRSGPALRQGVVDAVLAALAGETPAYLADPSVTPRGL
jgi:phosphoglycerate dehydrogenase-like enzyme